jgi:hypothetical protein
VDSLNVELFERLSSVRIDNNRIKGSIDLLEAWLARRPRAEQSRNAVRPLRALQAIRSASAAHRKGSKLETTLSKVGLAGLTDPKKFEKLLIEVSAALAELAAVFAATE